MMRAVVLAVSVLAGCSDAITFSCGDDSQCNRGGVKGLCIKPPGVCANPSTSCASGFVYDPSAGGLAGQCVSYPDGGAPDLFMVADFATGDGPPDMAMKEDFPPPNDLLNVPAWMTLPSMTTEALYAVWGTSSTDVYAVGDGATILHWDGTSWSKQSNAAPAATQFHGVWGSSATDVWVVGTDINLGNLEVFHSAGAGTWTATATGLPPRDYATGVWGASSTAVYISAVQLNQVYKWDGTKWSAISTTNLFPWGGVWGADANNVYFVGQDGNNKAAAYFFAFGAFTNQTAITGTAQPIRAVWGNGAADVYAVGNTGTVWHKTISGWASENSGVVAAISGVGGSGTSNIYAVGSSGTLIHSNGAGNWSQLNPGVSSNLSGIWVAPDSTVFVVGDSGVILKH